VAEQRDELMIATSNTTSCAPSSPPGVAGRLLIIGGVVEVLPVAAAAPSAERR
jgi:hypothetical protein